MSESISCSARVQGVLERIRRGDTIPEHDILRALGEECPREFFRILIESLADSFEPEQAAAYESLMRPWIPEQTRPQPTLPETVEHVFVLSRVTLGADVKITSILLDAAKRRFPKAKIVLVGGQKSAELFSADRQLGHLEAEYPRSGSVSARIDVAHELARRMRTGHRIVIDPDSRLTQLGLIPVCEPECHFHFPSRILNADSQKPLGALANEWLAATLGQTGTRYIAPQPVQIDSLRPRVAVSFGVGENEAKRLGDDFEVAVLNALATCFRTIWVDRGAGGEEARRVTAAVQKSSASDRVRFWEGSFAGFSSVIAQSDLYVGYDSAGQHAAAAAGTPLISIFAGAPSSRFRNRWTPEGSGWIRVIAPDGLEIEAVLTQFASALEEQRGACPGHSR